MYCTRPDLTITLLETIIRAGIGAHTAPPNKLGLAELRDDGTIHVVYASRAGLQDVVAAHFDEPAPVLEDVPGHTWILAAAHGELLALQVPL